MCFAIRRIALDRSSGGREPGEQMKWRRRRTTTHLGHWFRDVWTSMGENRRFSEEDRSSIDIYRSLSGSLDIERSDWNHFLWESSLPALIELRGRGFCIRHACLRVLVSCVWSTRCARWEHPFATSTSAVLWRTVWSLVEIVRSRDDCRIHRRLHWLRRASSAIDLRRLRRSTVWTDIRVLWHWRDRRGHRSSSDCLHILVQFSSVELEKHWPR